MLADFVPFSRPCFFYQWSHFPFSLNPVSVMVCTCALPTAKIRTRLAASKVAPDEQKRQITSRPASPFPCHGGNNFRKNRETTRCVRGKNQVIIDRNLESASIRRVDKLGFDAVSASITLARLAAIGR
jgi:hypothetical protein